MDFRLWRALFPHAFWVSVDAMLFRYADKRGSRTE